MRQTRKITCKRCNRGQVYLDGFTNTCPVCEADYNHSGTLLVPRSQWGEETGETAADILTNVDYDPEEVY